MAISTARGVERATARWRRLVRWGRPVLATLVTAAALAVLTDRRGLRADFHPLAAGFDDPPAYSRVEGSLALDTSRAQGYFHNVRSFGVRWRGWIRIPRRGSYRFTVFAQDRGWVAIDGRTVSASPGLQVAATAPRRVRLDAGLHRIEVGYLHHGPLVDMKTKWRRPGPGDRSWQPLPPELLFAERPGPARRAVRTALADLSPFRARLLGWTVLFVGLLLFAGPVRELTGPPPGQPAGSGEATTPRWGRGRLVYYGGLFLLSLTGIFPFTASPFGWDDVRYLNVATFDLAWDWIVHRYAHVYLMKPFIGLAGGDAFLGARLMWSLFFALTIVFMAVAARAIGPRLQIRTFLLSLLFLFSQPLFFLEIGGAVPDFTVGWLVMIATALYLLRLERARPPGFEWHALLIGALTVWAFKSKELGAILLWLPVLFVFDGGRLDLRRCGRRIGPWLLGAAAGLLALMVLDGLVLGDFLYGVRPANLRATSGFNLLSELQQPRELQGWIPVIWHGQTTIWADDPRMKYLYLFAIFAAWAATSRRQPLELRLLHLMPLLYVLLLIVTYIRAPHAFLPRYLYPVVPVTCVLAAFGFHYLGLEELRWRQMLRARFFVPAFGLGVLVLGVLVPYQLGLLSAEELLPAATLRALQWKSLPAFIELVLVPILALIAIGVLVAFHHRRAVRLLVATAILLYLIGPAFRMTVFDLSTRNTAQRADTILYPLRVFGPDLELDRDPTPRVAVSPTLVSWYGMFGHPATYDRIAAVFFERYVWIEIDGDPRTLPDYLFVSFEDLEQLRQTEPELAATARFDPAGVVALLEPRRALGGG